MSLKILKAGIFDSFQDQGRYGYQQWGVNPGGVMDQEAACIANALVGNSFDEAVLEMHFQAPVFLFDQSAVIALAGADFCATINGEPVPLLHPLVINKSTVLQFHSAKNGARCYLAVKGGFFLPKWLNSYSTNLKAEAGGWNGVKLQKGDSVPLRDASDYSSFLGGNDFKILPWKAGEKKDQTARGKILALPGSEWNWLHQTSQTTFLNTEFVITHLSDRMGYRLLGTPLQCTVHQELVSSAVCFGTVQLLPDGQLIVLMADHQTTGGYPRLAAIITAHLPRLAQLIAGDKVQFEFTTPKKAEELYILQKQHLHQLQNACTFRLQNFFKEGGHLL